MRIVTYGAACSLDGFIARADGGLDWLIFTKDVHAVMAEYWPRIDTVLMGRKTWEQSVIQGGGAAAAGIATYVFSRTLRARPSSDVELVQEDVGDFVRALKRRPGKEICVMGGGELARSLFAAGLIDEVGVNIHPVLLGSGVPLFVDPGRETPLELAECRQLEGGCVLATYRVQRAAREA